VAGVPRKYLYDLLLVLIWADFLDSWTGARGGYPLTRAPDGITLLEIAELLDGPIRGTVPKQVSGADPGIDRRVQAVCDAAAGIRCKIPRTDEPIPLLPVRRH
jgi:DNA-binding IscR family transcriptional regulator